ncbi:nucleotidyl transferase AbiEii/AbiGii toxin family protein [Trinickia dinghuensis]|uniref:Nucleotidyl transferase AbiEii/AbiGii toxin family protein n=1 Tax=Trinickia dinghuensis TaxID=2291023 RepID=A0A3D8JTM3_9BURK|nr:nucleotidyl transferase AbiEii/AbiGii toxin family protein [Trinickia dinghuensis]RDU96016.1 nucleotidyl transferase AbiEii/AbiGii toxin family protein [Trinickia dinghuensis]
MRTISETLKAEIEDAANAGMLGNLPPAAAEKDIHITDALFPLSRVRLAHVAHQRDRARGDCCLARVEVLTHLVFAGGTCLSKAHGLIDWMSEDIDVKVVLDAVPDGYALPQGQTNRKRLGDLHDEVERRLKSAGFEFAQTENSENPLCRDSRRYYCLALSYEGRFRDVSGVLRPQLKLELIHRPPKLRVQELEMGYLLDRFVPRKQPHRFSMVAISTAETLAEKVLSLLRRCAWKWDGHQRGTYDSALVRHIYDVWRIAERHPESIEQGRTIFAGLIATDAEEFRKQHPEFNQQPYRVLRRTLERSRTHDELRKDFEQRLKPLLFTSSKPDFEVCFASFTEVATRLLDSDMITANAV